MTRFQNELLRLPIYSSASRVALFKTFVNLDKDIVLKPKKERNALRTNISRSKSKSKVVHFYKCLCSKALDNDQFTHSGSEAHLRSLWQCGPYMLVLVWNKMLADLLSTIVILSVVIIMFM